MNHGRRHALRYWCVASAFLVAGACVWVLGLTLCAPLVIGTATGVLLAIAMIWRVAARPIPLGGDRSDEP
jgi:hypothetical protein